MTEATPRPWAIGSSGRCIVKTVPDIADGYDHYTIAVLSGHSLISRFEAKANAALIVEAVNTYGNLKSENARLRADLNHALLQSSEAHRSLGEAIGILRGLLAVWQPFTSKPIGAPHSPARMEQDAQVAAYNAACAFIDKHGESK